MLAHAPACLSLCVYVCRARACVRVQEEARRKEKSSYAEDQTLEWRGGLAQKRAAEERRKTMAEEVRRRARGGRSGGGRGAGGALVDAQLIAPMHVGGGMLHTQRSSLPRRACTAALRCWLPAGSMRLTRAGCGARGRHVPVCCSALHALQAAKPFARSADDNVEWDASLRERAR